MRDAVGVGIDGWWLGFGGFFGLVLEGGEEAGFAFFFEPALAFDVEDGCASCRTAPLLTDLEMHNVGTAGPTDKPGQRFDTPTLVEAWRTAPYLHDGSAATIGEAIRKLKLPNTEPLSEEQVADLEAYVLSL